MSTWQLQEAKNKFSQVVQDAMTEGPQTITKRGVESVVIISKKEYNDLAKNQKSLQTILKNTPKADLEINRDKEKIREVEL